MSDWVIHININVNDAHNNKLCNAIQLEQKYPSECDRGDSTHIWHTLGTSWKGPFSDTIQNKLLYDIRRK